LQWDPVLGQGSTSAFARTTSSEGKAKAEAIKAKMIVRCIVNVEKAIEGGNLLKRVFWFEFDRKKHLGPFIIY
jgi:hypothetical protein